CMQHKALPLTF
nr:immunoglobulin light chain junction region [Macaca mulatta]MOV64451.1 immunoglobulin light chain junction region [Macaca mulatta]MOW08859.1 immunoglobulin light chain junction region [Macaca mulatta]MOX07373.1 immunoglobulin light chain junction region [Macaca mulatta]MOX07530.1 immunoglobulin light chain junction region [Macaca mulatta]